MADRVITGHTTELLRLINRAYPNIKDWAHRIALKDTLIRMILEEKESSK